jgi:ClpP class serine protease
MVDKYYGLFVRAVKRNRNAEDPKSVREGYGEGRMLLAQDAVKEKLVDRVGTFDQVIGELQAKLAKKHAGTSRRASAERAQRIAAAQN